MAVCYKKIIGQKCYLSPVTPEDAYTWTEWFNDLEVSIPLGGVEAYMPGSLFSEQEKIMEILQGENYVFNIVELESDTLIGMCGYYELDLINRCARLQMVIGEKDCWDMGYGQDAARLLLDFGFNILNLNNIMLQTLSFNQRAIHLYRSIGFSEIGRRRQARIVGNARYDLIFMDMLSEEFDSIFIQRLLADYPPDAFSGQ